MANYNCVVRTNYFHVKDMDAFLDLMNRTVGSEDGVELWEETDQDGNPIYAFGCYGGIAGLPNESDDEIDDDSYDRFTDELQKCVAENDAVIVMESGHEKLRYVTGSAFIITSNDTKYLDVETLALEATEKMVGTEFVTRMDY